MSARLSAILLEAIVLGLLASPVVAQQLPPVEVTAPDPRRPEANGTAPAKPEVIIGGQAAPPRRIERCVEVEAGGARSFGCLNETMKRDVDKVNPVANVPPIDARSGDTKTGVVNIPGVQQQYGQNFGRSVVPFRLPQPTFNGNPRR